MRTSELRTTRARARGWSSFVPRLALVAGPAVLALALAAGAPPAAADQTDQAGDGPAGYEVSVNVRFSGNAAPGGHGGATVPVKVRAACYWSHAEGPYTDMAAMLDWYDGATHGLQTRGILDQFGPRSVWEAAKKAEAGGKDLSWYRVFCQDPADYKDYNGGVADWVDPITGTPQGWVTYLYRTFPAGAAFPPPLVKPAELARVAHDLMNIEEPETYRNPELSGPGAPTLVGYPTWFWVRERAAVGGLKGTLTIRADLGDVWARVDATTGGLKLRSPAGGADCVPERAVVKYGPNVPEASGCTIEFSQASVGYPGGFPVTATTEWNATWTGSDGTRGTNDLAPLRRDVTTQVPVAEVQNVVTR